MYDVTVITDRNYGLYNAFNLAALGLKNIVLYLKNKNKKEILEFNIWNEEKKEDYLISLNKMEIEVINIDYLFYNIINNIGEINFFSNFKNIKIKTKFIVFALNKDSKLISCQNVSIFDFSFNNICFVFGEKALYENKIFTGDIFAGESIFLSQQIYNRINNSNENITIHSTELIKN